MPVRPRSSRRSGFTIIELMVVISLIALLLSITVTVVGAFVNNAREAATQATMHKINGMLRQRGETMRRVGARKGYWDSQPEALVATVVPGAGRNHRRALTIKLTERKIFPQRRQEVLDADYMTGMQLYPDITATPITNSADILYAVLTQGAILGDTPVEADAFSPNELKDTNANGLQEFVDGWGRPLRFYRWPTKFITTPEAKMKIQSLGTMNVGRDADDPLEMLTTIPNFETIGIPANKYMSTALAGPIFHTPATYCVPLIVSAGEDGILGLWEPDDTSNNGHLGAIKDNQALLDDIISVGMKIGGR